MRCSPSVHVISVFGLLLLPLMARLTNRKITHMISLIIGGLGLASIYIIKDPSQMIFSMIGVIMLMGLVTKNAILLVDFANQARAEGESLHDALIKAGKLRLRPILMTTAAMVFGPMTPSMRPGL